MNRRLIAALSSLAICGSSITALAAPKKEPTHRNGSPATAAQHEKAKSAKAKSNKVKAVSAKSSTKKSGKNKKNQHREQSKRI